MTIKEDSISSRLVFAFEAKDLKEVAAKIDEKYTSLHNWTSGRRDFPTEILIKIAKMTNRSIDWVLTGVESQGITEVSFDKIFEEKIRKIVREEIKKTYQVEVPPKNLKKEKKIISSLKK